MPDVLVLFICFFTFVVGAGFIVGIATEEKRLSVTGVILIILTILLVIWVVIGHKHAKISNEFTLPIQKVETPYGLTKQIAILDSGQILDLSSMFNAGIPEGSKFKVTQYEDYKYGLMLVTVTDSYSITKEEGGEEID